MSKPNSKLKRWVSTLFDGWGVRAVMLSEVALALMALLWQFPWPSGFPVVMYRSSHLLPKCLQMHVSKGYTGFIYGPPVGGICACKMKVVFGFSYSDLYSILC